ncbi:MAG: glycoside hydrolase family 2 [Ruminococcaceae bacterium]|nr:glycoside hydrolase family 2 [Oscillospiraceae bacterium]
MKNEIYEPLLTKYAESMDKETPWNIYPRPQMKRDSFLSLNGEWDFKIERGGADTLYSGKILVPFPPESKLSGVEMRIEKKDVMIYTRSFTLPEGFIKKRVILHFGAVDQLAQVYINGKEAGTHIGGYIPFSFDITKLLLDGENEICVKARDELSKVFTYGKQKKNRGGMWYTPVSGIWQTVWIESIPDMHIESIKIEQTSKNVKISVNSEAEIKRLTLLSDGSVYEFSGDSIVIEPESKILWTPENPYLYEFSIETETDKIESYFALRSLDIKEAKGKRRLCLNGEPYFFSGLLDQGYFPDGIFLPATPEGYRDDILNAKRLGFNMLRKHIKIEPMIFYYLCDKLGMAVFQDMVNNSGYSFIFDTALPTVGFKKARFSLRHKNKKSREFFLSEMKKTAELLYNTPSVCLYTIFNEGWGQFLPDKAYRLLKEIDSTRFVDSTSGWFYATESDVDSRHIYFKAPKISKPNGRPFFLSEFGGFSLRIDGHLFGKRNYGYSLYRDKESFTDAVCSLYTDSTAPLIKEGLCATVYTQLTDVEDETNGLITYDRRVIKIDCDKMKQANDILYKEFADATRDLSE